MIEKIKIPEERVAILIGKKGKIKKEIEDLTITKITIDEDVTIAGECIGVMACCNIIKAVGRGFAPEKALDLADEEYCLCIMPLPEKGKERVKSRIIGRGGSAREKIELFTRTHVSVYGKTVSVIGKYEDVELTKIAIEKIISGAMHKNVFSFLEKKLKSRVK